MAPVLSRSWATSTDLRQLAVVEAWEREGESRAMGDGEACRVGIFRRTPQLVFIQTQFRNSQ